METDALVRECRRKNRKIATNGFKKQDNVEKSICKSLQIHPTIDTEMSSYEVTTISSAYNLTMSEVPISPAEQEYPIISLAS